MHQPVLETTLLILLTVLLVNIAFRLIRIPIILGYVLAGVAVGPEVLGFVTNIQSIQYLAEFGVVLLMFTIGLEFSLSKLITLRYSVFILGGLQVMFCILLTMLVSYFMPMTLQESFLVGCVVAMSSTALVVKQLSQQNEVHKPHGLNAVGVLLFQDLAVVPMLIIVASLGEVDGQTLIQTLPWALLRGLVAIVVILVLGRWVLRPLFHSISATKATELFTLTVLFVALGSAWITDVFGMTFALGAFLSGIMLGETEYRQKIKDEIRPFRDVLLGLFFVSVGMLANISTWLGTWIWIVLTLCAVMIGKAMVIIFLSRLSTYDTQTSIRTGLILAQGGEFGFAVLGLGLDNQLIPMDYGQVVLAALIISFASAPIIIRHNQRIAQWFLPNAFS